MSEEWRKYGVIVWPVPELGPEGHVTILFLGATENLNVTPEQIVAALSNQNLRDPGFQWAVALEMFGAGANIPVLTMDPILAVQREVIVAHLTDKLGLKDSSEFEYRPHMSLYPPVDLSVIRAGYILGKPEVWWNDTHYGIN